MRMVDVSVTGDKVDVGGRRLWWHRLGTGGPTVVFLPGASAVGLDQVRVHQLVGELTTSVIYDRAGTGSSDPVALPRTAREVVAELREFLGAIGESGPYVLVGHSLGGAYARYYARRFPDEVAGLVLPEPTYEHWNEWMPEHLHLIKSTGEHPFREGEVPPELVVRIRGILEGWLADWPSGPDRDRLIELHSSPEVLHVGALEGGNLLEVTEEVRDAGPQPPNVPQIVLGCTGLDEGYSLFQSDEEQRERIDGAQRMYLAIAAETPDSEYRAVPDAGHSTIPYRRPDAMATAVSDLLGRLGKR